MQAIFGDTDIDTKTVTMADGKVVGQKISKEYRDRYANFSKGAHFVFGTQGKSTVTTLLDKMLTCAFSRWNQEVLNFIRILLTSKTG